MGRRGPGRFMVVAIAAAALTNVAVGSAVAGTTAAVAPRLALAPNHLVRTGHSPRAAGIAATGWTSSNWSGYAVTSGAPYTQVSSAWIVPKVSATSTASFSAAWLGIDGFNNASLIQTGTEQDYYLGSAHYNAWWTTSDLGFLEQPIGSMTIKPGDLMISVIAQVTPGNWIIIIIDATAGTSFVKQTPYHGPGASAEWIQEAPGVGGSVATLAHYGATRFDGAKVNGVSPNLSASNSGALLQGGVVVSMPSDPDVETAPATPDGFAIAYGPTAPPAPKS